MMRQFLFTGLLLSVASASYGQPSPPPSQIALHDAEAIAVKNNPQISVARLTALASQQVTREVRSNLWPTATTDITAVDAHPAAVSQPAASTTRSSINVPLSERW